MSKKALPNFPDSPVRGAEKEMTELTHNTEAMRLQTDCLRAIAEATPIAMMLYAGKTWLYINPATEAIFGYRASELYSKSFLDLVHPDFQLLIRERPSQMEHATHRLEFIIRTKAGEDKWVSGAETFTTLEGRQVGVISVLDITDRKQAEDALRASEEKYRLLVETATDVVFTMNDRLEMTYISPVVFRLLGFTAEEALKRKPADILTPPSYELAMRLFAEEMSIEADHTQDKNRIRVIELEEYCKDGSTIWTETTFNAIRDEEGKFIGMLGITRDISGRKRAEKEREKLIQERETALSEMKILSGMLPICATCKKIRDDSGYWNQIESYIKSHSEADFSHSICPECAAEIRRKLYMNKPSD